MHMIVSADGSIHCIYGESISLPSLGKLTITRASHVEPTGQGLWCADLSPVDGPLLGPFSQRSQALAAERQWLEAKWWPNAQRS